MFTFLNPIFLWAGAAAVVPLLLHLMQRRRVVRVPFSTIRFLKLAQQRSSRRARLENFLLWLARTLLVLLLVAAFAAPVLRRSSLGGVLGRPRRDIALVLDGSFSMEYQVGRARVWGECLDAAAALVAGLRDGDRVCVFRAADVEEPVIPQLTADRELVTAQVRGLAAGRTSSQLLPAVRAACRALAAESPIGDREVHIITDGQLLPWMSFRQAGAGTDGGAAPADAWRPDKIDKALSFFVLLLGPEAPANCAPAGLDVQPALIGPETSVRIAARVARSGASDTALTLMLDGREVARRALGDGAAATGELVFTLPPMATGVHAGWLETPPDPLAVDNRFYFALEVRDAFRVLCVGSEAETFFVTRALHPGAGASVIDADVIRPDAVSGTDLGSYSCVFLCNALPLAGQAMAELEAYVRQGGMLVLFPGDGAAPRDYAPWSILPGLPSAIEEVPSRARTRTLRWASAQAGWAQELGAGMETLPVVTVMRELRWSNLDPAARVLLVSAEDLPFLITRDAGKGQVAVFSVSADRAWSNLPLTAFYLPLLHQMVRAGAGIAARPPFVWAARSLVLSDLFPAVSAESALLDPAGAPVPIRSVRVEGGVRLQAEGLFEPGLYTLRSGGGGGGDAGGVAELVLAVNVDRAESDLAVLDPAELPELLGTSRLLVARDRGELERGLEEHRAGWALGEPLLCAALVLATLELLLANRGLARCGPAAARAAREERTR